ncbi:MAG: hypothetical protein ABI467_06140 [Kofleriaceae bacterium]
MWPMWTSLASFHPGHGTTAPGTVLHYVVEPVHAIPLALAVAALLGAAGGLWWWLTRTTSSASSGARAKRP